MLDIYNLYVTHENAENVTWIKSEFGLFDNSLQLDTHMKEPNQFFTKIQVYLSNLAEVNSS